MQIKTLPAYHPPGSDIYLAGSFNGWNPRDENFKFRHENNTYSIDLFLSNGNYEYKITRGGWDKAECKKDGEATANRLLNPGKNDTVELIVAEWADRFPAKPRKSTASNNVSILDTAFLIPQLKRTRRIWVYIPDNYNSSKERFPVLYMHDGQNLFDDATAYSGEWGVDEFLDSLKTNETRCIVVGIDNGGIRRLNEYSPYDFILDTANKKKNKGEGKAYVDFIVKTLKPYIDKKYRTDPATEQTAIAGSSMGGLISLYAALKYPKVFGTVGVFSPSFWIAPGIYNEIKGVGKKLSSKVYLYAGGREGERMTNDVLKAFELMKKSSKAKLEMLIHDEGDHSEATWRKEFGRFYRWMNNK